MERDKLLGTMDAKVWTDEFMATKARLGNKEFDHAMMLSWFANAIMAGFDEANRRAQRALDAEREKVKFGSCEACWNLAWVLCRDDEPNAVPMKCANGTTYWRCDYCWYKQQLATLQAQLRQVEGERDHAKKMEAVQKEVADNQAWHVRQLRQLVEVHTKQLTELTIIPIGCSREQELRWTQSIKDLRATLAAKDAGKEVGNGL